MAERTAAVRIDDLADPIHPAQLAQTLAQAEQAASDGELELDRLYTRAREETGLSNFGAPDFRERVARYAAALRREGRLSGMGRLSRASEIVRFLKNRLRVEDLIARHPEIEAIPITRPIVITGFPRTGTTHLHNSLAADPELRYLPYWEAVEPVPSPEDLAAVARGEEDPRIARCRGSVAFVNESMPHFPKMHEMTFDHAHEEIDLLAIDFSTMYLEAPPGPLIEYARDYRQRDQAPHYRYMRRVLQVLTFLRGGRRWVLKSPQHLEQLRPLKAVFPDASLVLTHRDPLPVIASYATMICYTARLQQKRPDPAAYGRYVVERMTDLLGACLRDRDLWPASQSIDVRFQEFVADQDGAVESVYAKAGQPFSEASRLAVADYARTHPAGRHGRIAYDLAQLGLAAGALRDRFADYCTRFGVKSE